MFPVISRKLLESTPSEEEKENDDEMGGATTRGRSYTILPMLGKFIASTLLVMVTLEKQRIIEAGTAAALLQQEEDKKNSES